MKIIQILTIGLLALTGCVTALKSDKIVAVKQRCFGIVVETASTASGPPSVKLGFVSTVVQIIPTSTNGPIYAPEYVDTFDLGQGAMPFTTSISEDTGTGQVTLGGTNGAGALRPILGARLTTHKNSIAARTNSVVLPPKLQ
jgi:hypothetical protein